MSQHPKIDSTGYGRRPNPVCSKRILATLAAVTLIAGCSGEAEKAEKTEAAPEAAVEAHTDGAAPVVAAAVEVAATPAAGEPGGEERAAGFAAEAAKRVVDDKPNVQGDDPAWFFLNRELRQMGLGKFWETGWSGTADGGTNPETGTDPMASMVEFNEMLKAKGVELILVPIPAKASIYPDKLAAGFDPADPYSLSDYLAKLTAAGLKVIDLEPVMRQRRSENPDEKLWCEQDAHYSPLACEIIAGLVKEEIEGQDWFAAQPKEKIVRTEAMELQIEGDQVDGSEWEGKTPKETLVIRYAGRGPEGGGNLDPVEPDPESPVLLMGDSHTLVFQEGADGGMHCKGAGLLDQLAFELQFAPDHVGARGSGLVQARKQLYYQRGSTIPGYWDKKKVVIWVFSAREFTQSFDKIMTIPIERP